MIDLRKAFEILADQRKTGVCRQIIGQAFNVKIDHGRDKELRCVIITPKPFSFTRKVRPYRRETRAVVGGLALRSRIQVTYKVRTLAFNIEILFFKYCVDIINDSSIGFIFLFP